MNEKELQICDGSVGSQVMLNVGEMVGDEGLSSKGVAWDNKCEHGEEMDDEDQIKKWQELRKQGSDDYCLVGVNLLKAMEMDEGDIEMDSEEEDCHVEQAELRKLLVKSSKLESSTLEWEFVRIKRC
jgi:hypothetical protein